MILQTFAFLWNNNTNIVISANYHWQIFREYSSRADIELELELELEFTCKGLGAGRHDMIRNDIIEALFWKLNLQPFLSIKMLVRYYPTFVQIWVKHTADQYVRLTIQELVSKLETP